MTITYELTKEDGVALMKYLWQRPERRKRERRENDTIAIAFSVVIWLLVSQAAGNIGLLIALGVGLWLLKALPDIRSKRGERWVNSDGFQQWLGERTTSAEENGLRVASSRGERLIYWNRIEEVIETESHLFLPFGMLEVVVIPKRAFESEELKTAFVSELHARRTPTPEPVVEVVETETTEPTAETETEA
jgi:YcxB-like protein